MKLYWIGCADCSETIELGDPDLYYTERFDGSFIVAAPTRGKAKSIVCSKYRKEWTDPMNIRQLGEDEAYKEGFVEDPLLWLHFTCLEHQDDTEEANYWHMCKEDYADAIEEA